MSGYQCKKNTKGHFFDEFLKLKLKIILIT